WRDSVLRTHPAAAVRLRDTGAVDITELTGKILGRREKDCDPLRIVQAGHPALRRRAVRARERLEDGRLEVALLLELAEAMTVTMRAAPGVGLAAPQVGLPLSFYVIEDRYADEPGEDEVGDLLERRPLPRRALLAPVLEPLGTQRVYAFEGCLSVDGWQSIVPRSRRVLLRATELLGDGSLREVEEEHVGWTARILQHETDHLAGTLCHDLCVPRSYTDARYGSRGSLGRSPARRDSLTLFTTPQNGADGGPQRPEHPAHRAEHASRGRRARRDRRALAVGDRHRAEDAGTIRAPLRRGPAGEASRCHPATAARAHHEALHHVDHRDRRRHRRGRGAARARHRGGA